MLSVLLTMGNDSTQRKQLLLTPLSELPGVVIVSASGEPIFYGSWCNGGIDYICGHCRATVIAENVAEDQIWNLAFECFTCSKPSMSPVLPPGMAYPSRTTLPFTKPGRYLFSRTAIEGICLVGPGAIESRGSEFEESLPQLHSSPDEVLKACRNLIHELLGDKLGALQQRDRNGQLSKTPPVAKTDIA